MRRREFIKVIGGAVAWPVGAWAQPETPVIGYLHNGTPVRTLAFRQGLADAGYVPGQNVAIEFRWSNHRTWLLPQLAADLVERKVAVIVTTGSPQAALAAKSATSTIPIVFALADDPVRYGLVASFSRPGGNITGLTSLTGELTGKRLDLLLELVPEASTIAYLSGPSDAPIFENRKSDILAAGRMLGRKILLLEVRGRDFEAAFRTLVQQRADALIVGSFRFFLNPETRDAILRLATRHKIATIYPNRSYTDHGGLMSYDTDHAVALRVVGSQYVGRILKGAKPADLPVMGPTKFELVINLKTAKALGLTFPPSLFATANEVIR
jgi:putative ABC transport system substrate-binding protein